MGHFDRVHSGTIRVSPCCCRRRPTFFIIVVSYCLTICVCCCSSLNSVIDVYRLFELRSAMTSSMMSSDALMTVVSSDGVFRGGKRIIERLSTWFIIVESVRIGAAFRYSRRFEEN